MNCSDARRAILDMLREKGVDLGHADEFFDLFGVHSLNSLWRYVRFRVRAAMVWAPLTAVVLAIIGLSFGAALLLDPNRIYVPTKSQVEIGLYKSGRTACENEGLVCVSVSQMTVSHGNFENDEFYGYTTPTCDSVVRRSQSCKNSYKQDYELADVVLVKSRRSEIKKRLFGKQNVCLSDPVYKYANCVDPIGD